MKLLLAACLLLCFCNSIFEARPQWGFGEIPGGGAYGVTYGSGPWTFGVGGSTGYGGYGGAGVSFSFR